MWEFLYQLSTFAQQQHFPKQDTSSFSTNLEQTLEHIKQIMWYYGYRSSDFFSLPSDLSYGSQDLLLACGWLIAKTHLISKLMESSQTPFLGGDTSFLHEQKSQVDVSRTLKQGCQTLSPSGKVKYLAWKAGQCKMAWRGLYMKQQELCTLTHQIHLATQGVSISSDLQHLSVLETFLLRHPHHMQKYQDLLHAEILRLQTCVKWREQEHVFWQWMESVLDSKLSKNESEDTQAGDTYPLDNFAPTQVSYVAMHTSRELKQLCKELGDLIMQIQGCLQHVPEEQYQLISEDIELMKQDIASDVEKKISSLKYQTDLLPSQRQPIRLQYIPSTDKGARNSRLNKPVDESQSVRNEIDRLELIVRDLELQHREMQEKMRVEMDEIGHKLNGVICIPPMGKTK
ncbi:uncharacterized protein [Amphiura filiformis]|uniref:uncharacterized protein n=1 Tax=Amphiura filiformis TaxID=82378 RepID=UPI003B2142CD